MTGRQCLHSGWILSPVVDTLPEDAPAWSAGVRVPATVPGTVHTDLLVAGLIPDPYLDENEAGLRWIWRTDWQYETTFSSFGDAADRTELVCEGLDTVATIELNGTTVATTANMHRSYRFDVSAGIYESDAFYGACDELGILIWQDFLFACAAYPEEEPIHAEVAAEAAQNVVRLMPHPSLVLWNGNNENFMGWHEWGWPAIVGDRTWGLGYYTELLPKIVGDLDGTRPYWPGSPYSGSLDRPSGLDGYGCKHVWDVWNTADYSVYRRDVPRFVSEFGWQAPPTWATLTQSVHDEPTLPDSRGVLAHQKATDGNGKLARGLAPHFPEPKTMEDWHFAHQLNQCRAISTAIEHFRSHRGACMGTIVWQLNDCWPVTSWAAIDGYGRLKPLWYTLRRVYQPRLLTVQPRHEALHAVLVNDTSTPWDARVVVRRVDTEGTVLARWEADGSTAPTSVRSLPIPLDVATPTRPEHELLVVTVSEQRATWFFVEDRDFAYPRPELAVEVDGGANPVVRVTAGTLVRDLALFADRLDPAAEVDDMLITLLPGESREFRVSGASGLAAGDLKFPVLRSANDLVPFSGSCDG